MSLKLKALSKLQRMASRSSAVFLDNIPEWVPSRISKVLTSISVNLLVFISAKELAQYERENRKPN